MLKVNEKGWVKKLFSEEEGWGEDEARYIEGLGWLIFIVEDNAGSVTIWVTKEKMEEYPFGEEEYERVLKSDNLITLCKLGYYGSFGPSEKGEGYFCTDMNEKELKYRKVEKFSTFDEGDSILEEYLNKYVV